MGFAPQVPLGGPAGWRFLVRTEAAQRAAFARSPEVERELAYFRERIGGVETAAELVADRRLLTVALGAFGLESEIDKRAFVRRALEEGAAPGAFAARLGAPGWRQMAAAFGFGDAGGVRTGAPGFAAGIEDRYRARAFEAAVGETRDDMRLALNFRREIAALANGGSWYAVLGSKPLRKVFETAFGLPSAFGRIDVDRQREVLRAKTREVFGSAELAAFKDPVNVERMIERFLARAQIEAGAGASAAPVLALFQPGGASGSAGLLNLLAARG